jgi:hypothetical protein
MRVTNGEGVNMKLEPWMKNRRKAEGLIRQAAIHLTVACGEIMPHPEVASMAAASAALQGVLELLELTGPAPTGRSRLVVKLLKERRGVTHRRRGKEEIK